jgi:hypothetical protein
MTWLMTERIADQEESSITRSVTGQTRNNAQAKNTVTFADFLCLCFLCGLYCDWNSWAEKHVMVCGSVATESLQLTVHTSDNKFWVEAVVSQHWCKNAIKATLKNAVFWDVTRSASCKIRLYGETYRLYSQGENNQRGRKTLAVTRNWSMLTN